MSGIKSFEALNGAPSKGLLGLGGIGGARPPIGLLGPFYDPAEMRRQQLKQTLLGAGVAMLRNGKGSFGEVLGNSLAGGLESGNQAGQDYTQNAMGYQQMAQQQEEQRAKQEQKAFVSDYLSKKGPEYAAWAERFPELAAKEIQSEMFPQPGEAFTLGEGQVRYGPNGQQLAAGPVKTVSPTDDIREYEMAKQQGYPGTFQQYMLEMKKAGASSVNVNAPIPAEIGARIGLGERFLSTDFDDTVAKIQSGEATGPFDYLKGTFGRGDAGEVQRRMATGVDSLRRNLTGAGIAATEAADYARRYQPVWSDDADTLERKARGLKADLEAVAQGALAGKAGTLQTLLRGQQGWGTTIDESMKNQTPTQQNGPKVIDGYTIRRVQ